MAHKPSSAPGSDEPRGPILTQRGAVLVLLALITGFGAAWLMVAANHQVEEAILGGFAATAASLWWYDRLIA